jgi:hypothetical protein
MRKAFGAPRVEKSKWELLTRPTSKILDLNEGLVSFLASLFTYIVKTCTYLRARILDWIAREQAAGQVPTQVGREAQITKSKMS